MPHKDTELCPQKWKNIRSFEVDVPAAVAEVALLRAVLHSRGCFGGQPSHKGVMHATGQAAA